MASNYQQLFNDVVTGFEDQGFVPAVENGSCCYRTADGKKCALGQLIPDNIYSEDLENRTVHALPYEVLSFCGIDPYDDSEIKFLSDLQIAHDGSDTPEELKANLREFAESHELEVPDVLSL